MPDLILFNARVYTLDPQCPHATALAIRDGKILATGNDNEIQRLAGSQTHSINLNGHIVLPGLIDAHLHFEWYALNLNAVDANTTSPDECLHRVQAKTKTTPTGQWITGSGWDQNVWGSFPTARDLDSVAPEHPVFLTAKSGHAAWANSLAMKLAGISSSTADPASGALGGTGHPGGDTG